MLLSLNIVVKQLWDRYKWSHYSLALVQQ